MNSLSCYAACTHATVEALDLRDKQLHGNDAVKATN